MSESIASQSLRRNLFGMPIDAVTLDEAVTRVIDWTRSDSGVCRYVVTPNVDHAVMYQVHDVLRRAYRHAALVLADGAPIVLASRLLGKALPARVAGSDLVPALFAAASTHCDEGAAGRSELTVFLLGAAPGVADRAARNIHARWPSVRVTGTFSPPLGFERSADANREILNRIAAVRPDLLIVGLGAPKQERWVLEHHREIDAKVALCVGATIDFLAGHKRRAPVWMRKSGMEWLHRLACEPRRLLARYGRDAWIYPQLVWSELRGAV
ncbi:MAG: WecB/TagA/CpsF family glycosyltransferase [Pirellulales bacterium]